MDIIKAFNNNNLHTEITIKGTYEDPLFRASDVGLILEIKNIHSTINDFNNNEKVIHTMDTLGGPQEISFLTERGLYKLLFRSRKPIANQFQNWVCEVIKELRLKGKYELEKKLKETEEELSRYQKRNKIRYEKKDRIYVYEDITKDNKLVYKIGFTKNMNVRAETYDTCRFENNLKYELTCSNGRLLESVIHHVLQSKQDCEKKEWFHTTLDIIINTIENMQFLLDNFLNDIDENYLERNLELKQFFKKYKIYDDNNNNIVNNNEDIKFLNFEEKPLVKEKKTTKEFIYEKLDKFMLECCIIGTEHKAISTDIYFVFRKWNKGCTRNERTYLLEYIKAKFNSTRIPNKETNKNELGYKGFSVIDNNYKPKNDDNIYDKYIIQNCDLGLQKRTSLYNLINDFTKWIKPYNLEEKKTIFYFRKHIINNFFQVKGSFRLNGKNDSNGIYGICLKTETKNNFINTCGIRKKVYKINPKTNKVEFIFNSLTETTNILKNDMYYKVTKKIVHTDGYLYTFDNPNDK